MKFAHSLKLLQIAKKSIPGDFATKVKQINSQSDFNQNVKFCRPNLPHNQILCLHHFNLRSLYFQSLQSLTNFMQFHASEI